MKIQKQRGISSGLLLFILVTCGFFLTCFFKLGPAYLDNTYIAEALKKLAENHPEDLRTISKSTIRKELDRFYMLNNVRGEPSKVLDVDRKKEKAIISVNYEVRVPLILNIDVVMRFDNVLDSSNPEACCTVSDEAK